MQPGRLREGQEVATEGSEPMLIIPAIDLKDGRCVRLRQGRAGDSTVYSDDPPAMAARWVGQGARYLHVVDLDGAFRGRPVHRDVIARIAASVAVPIEAGGGLRSDADVRSLLDCGVSRAIIGTRAFAEPDALERLVGTFGSRLAVGIDARDGMVQVRGWVETTAVTALELARRADGAGVATLIVTDTSTDGMMRGVNAESVAAICGAVRCDVIASGGVTTVEDVCGLKALGCRNLAGAIVGKALYEGRVTLAELVAAAD
jgi:phosphoribosylformimino-5-aminoimidazole carboxamide ribotide isomerase